MRYTPTLTHMLSTIKQQYHQGALKSDALQRALEIVHNRLKEFHLLQGVIFIDFSFEKYCFFECVLTPNSIE